MKDAETKFARPWDGAAVKRQDTARWTERYLTGSISFEELFDALPEASDDEDVSALASLLEHEPQKGGWLGVSAEEYEQHMADVRRLVAVLLQRTPTP